MSAAAASASGGDGGEDQARKIDDRKLKDAERSRKRRADKKAKDEEQSKKIKILEAQNLEMSKSLQSLSVEIAAVTASNQRLLAASQRLPAETTVLTNVFQESGGQIDVVTAPDDSQKDAEIERLRSEIRRLESALKKSEEGKKVDQIIWDEVGDDQFEREKVLLDLEQECLEVYRRKVDSVNISRARRHPELAESEAEFTHLILSLGVDPWMGNASPSRYCVDNLVEPNGLTL